MNINDNNKGFYTSSFFFNQSNLLPMPCSQISLDIMQKTVFKCLSCFVHVKIESLTYTEEIREDLHSQ